MRCQSVFGFFDTRLPKENLDKTHDLLGHIIDLERHVKIYLLINLKVQKLSSQFIVSGGRKSAPIIGNADYRVSDNQKPSVVTSRHYKYI